jgi:hypothetical protein
MKLLGQARKQIPEAARSGRHARVVVKKRKDKMRSFFDSVAGRLGKDYVPGKIMEGPGRSAAAA